MARLPQKRKAATTTTTMEMDVELTVDDPTSHGQIDSQLNVSITCTL